MTVFTWHPSFVTDIPFVDEQHHGLVDLFNELSDFLVHNEERCEAASKSALDRLLTYAETHFREEEGMMNDVGLDPRHKQSHHNAHQDFLMHVRSLWDTRCHLSNPSETFNGFLTSWLGLHILGVDQSMARQVQLIRQGVLPTEAYEQEVASSDGTSQVLMKLIGQLHHSLTIQNNDLINAAQSLELRIEERTRDLTLANEKLTNANKLLERYSRTDGLLQIANRRYFDEQLSAACASAYRRQSPLGVLLVDVDFFKRYNDKYGHIAGDDCLRAVARAISNTLLRTTDFVARYGGEEFVLLLPDTDEVGSKKVANRVVQVITELNLPHEASTVSPHVTVSVGCISRIPRATDACDQLLSEADAALYRAKMNGRNRWIYGAS